MDDQQRFETLYARASGEAAGPGETGPLVCPPRPRPGETPIDMGVGLVMRAALAVQFFTWAADNAGRGADLRSWTEPEPGLVTAAGVWTLGLVDPALAAFVLLSTALALGVALSLGLLTRIAGFATMAGALWHALFVLPEAWPSALAWGALGLYLALRGAGPISLDWALSRLARLA